EPHPDFDGRVIDRQRVHADRGPPRVPATLSDQTHWSLLDSSVPFDLAAADMGCVSKKPTRGGALPDDRDPVPGSVRLATVRGAFCGVAGRCVEQADRSGDPWTSCFTPQTSHKGCDSDLATRRRIELLPPAVSAGLDATRRSKADGRAVPLLRRAA